MSVGVKRVLFVCLHNAGRSQMAQAFFERRAPEGVQAESAGTEPAQEISPAVIEAMAEVGIDLSKRRPRRLTPEMQRGADWAVTMGCGDACPYVRAPVEDWGLPDPAGLALEQVRAIREEVRARVDRLIDERIDQIRGRPAQGAA